MAKEISKCMADISGVCRGKEFTENCIFTLIKPKEKDYYGTGCYMVVAMSHTEEQLIDVRYEGTTDIRKLADMFIRSWYGNNAKKVSMTYDMALGEV